MDGAWLRISIWAIILSAIAAFANWPQNAGTLKPFIWQAGFPFTYAFWVRGELIRWDSWALLTDLLMWVAVFAAVGIAIWFSASGQSTDEKLPREEQARAS